MGLVALQQVESFFGSGIELVDSLPLIHKESTLLSFRTSNVTYKHLLYEAAHRPELWVAESGSRRERAHGPALILAF